MTDNDNLVYQALGVATHLLIAGTTGSGKSVTLRGIVSAILSDNTPDTARLLLIDPKMIDLAPFARAGEMVDGYTTDADDACRWLTAAVQLMQGRYATMQEQGLTMWPGPHLYIVIDELADLMIADCAAEFRRLLQRILQIGRAAGVHVIAATQAPNRRIIPAELVLNFTDRLALRCVSSIESRQIVGVGGAEELPEHGEALYLSPRGLLRVELPFMSEEEARAVIADCAARYPAPTPTQTPTRKKDRSNGDILARIFPKRFALPVSNRSRLKDGFLALVGLNGFYEGRGLTALVPVIYVLLFFAALRGHFDASISQHSAILITGAFYLVNFLPIVLGLRIDANGCRIANW